MQHVLVIDDDPAVTSLLQRGLSYERFDVETASDGEEGFVRARERYPDLEILDVMMPGMDGMEVLRRLRAGDPQLPVLMLTARDAPTDEALGFEHGADDYVTKPFTFDVLLARVRSLLRRQQAERPAILRFEDLCWTPAGAARGSGDRVDLDRVRPPLRMIGGAVLAFMGLAYLLAGAGSVFAWVLGVALILLGADFIFTGITVYCPLYDRLGWSTARRRKTETGEAASPVKSSCRPDEEGRRTNDPTSDLR